MSVPAMDDFVNRSVERPTLEEHGSGPAVRLALVIPAYNEAGAILGVLEQLTTTLEKDGLLDTEVIVVDDGSTDGTNRILNDLAANQEKLQLRIVTRAVNCGYGAALKAGIEASNAEWICITDADGTYPNDRIVDLMRVMTETKSDMVVGARVGNNVKSPLIRKPAKWVINRMVDYIASQRVPDFNSGLRIFKRDLALRFAPLLPDGFSFTTTITLGMLINGYRVEFVPIDYHPRVGSSKIAPIRDTARFIRMVAITGLYFAPLRIFLPFSGFLFAVAVLWGTLSRILFGQIADLTTLVIAMTALQIGALGLLAELINRRTPNDLQN